MVRRFDAVTLMARRCGVRINDANGLRTMGAPSGAGTHVQHAQRLKRSARSGAYDPPTLLKESTAQGGGCGVNDDAGR